MIHTCGTAVPSTIDDFVRHLADCEDGTPPELRAWSQEIVSAVAAFAAMDERSRKTIERDCERCGTPFRTANVRKRFCTTSCRSKGYRERSGGAS